MCHRKSDGHQATRRIRSVVRGSSRPVRKFRKSNISACSTCSAVGPTAPPCRPVLQRANEVGPAALVALYYTEAFADPESGAALPVHVVGPERAVDRLVGRLREADVGRVNHPILDRHLDYDVDSAIPWMTFEGRSGVAAAQLRRYASEVPRPGEDVTILGSWRSASSARGRPPSVGLIRASGRRLAGHAAVHFSCIVGGGDQCHQ